MKYNLGQIIKHKDDPDADFGEITAIQVTPQATIYTIALDDFDRNTRKLVPAVKHILEEDAVLKETVQDQVQAENSAEGEQNESTN